MNSRLWAYGREVCLRRLGRRRVNKRGRRANRVEAARRVECLLAVSRQGHDNQPDIKTVVSWQVVYLRCPRVHKEGKTATRFPTSSTTTGWTGVKRRPRAYMVSNGHCLATRNQVPNGVVSALIRGTYLNV